VFTSSLLLGWRVMLGAALVVSLSTMVFAKRTDDVVVLKNGDRLTGEIKKLQRGELTFKASYMAEAVRLDWSKVARLESRDHYLISMADGNLFSERFRLEDVGTNNLLIGVNGVVKVRQLDVVRILPIETSFWRQLEGSIDLGFSFTSGNDQYQTTFSGAAIYRRGDSSFTGRFDSSFSGQTEGSRSARHQFEFDYRKQLSPRWYVGGLFNSLSSDQQSLDLRLTAGGLLGRNLIRTERTQLSTFVGLAGSREKYKIDPARDWSTSVDAIGGLDFTTFRFSKAELTTRFNVYPSFTTPGRLRSQLKTDLRIKLAKDLWWGLHLYESFDSKPPISADKNDLGLSASIGWKF
jgi:putative salt-induced outer membrane protein YdiY